MPNTILNPWKVETFAKDVLDDKSSLVRKDVPVGPQQLRETLEFPRLTPWLGRLMSGMFMDKCPGEPIIYAMKFKIFPLLRVFLETTQKHNGWRWPNGQTPALEPEGDIEGGPLEVRIADARYGSMGLIQNAIQNGHRIWGLMGV